MRAAKTYSESIHTGSLILINAVHPNVFNSRPPLAPAVPNCGVLICSRASVMLSKLIEQIGGGHIIPVSGYRSLEEQGQIWNDSLKKNGREFTMKYIAPPGCSEHHTGLAIDLAEAAENIDFIRPSFPYDGICGKFRRLAPRYGFVERYGADKENVTGIAHEPWHFRYVGYPHSQLMYNMGLSMEEYIDLLRRYPYSGEHLFLCDDRYAAEVCFIKEDEPVDLPSDAPSQISGNNVDGFILTRWRTQA